MKYEIWNKTEMKYSIAKEIKFEDGKDDGKWPKHKKIARRSKKNRNE